MVFLNRMWDKFHNEIVEANTAALETIEGGLGPGPFMAMHFKQGNSDAWDATVRFRQMVQSGNKFKWTLNLRGDLGVIAPTLKHSIAAGGGEVWTAGHGVYIYDRKNNTAKMTLDNDTGHYHTTLESLKHSQTAWEYLGYNVEFQARTDFTTLKFFQ